MRMHSILVKFCVVCYRIRQENTNEFWLVRSSESKDYKGHCFVSGKNNVNVKKIQITQDKSIFGFNAPEW